MTDHDNTDASETPSFAGATPAPRTPRHRGDDNATAGHWWRTEFASSENPRRAKPEDDGRSPADPGSAGHPPRPRPPVVGPWLMLSPGGAAGDLTAEPMPTALQDLPTVPFRPSNSLDSRPLTRFTDRSALGHPHPGRTEVPRDNLISPSLSTDRDTAGSVPDVDTGERPSGAAAAATGFPIAMETGEHGLLAFARHARILIGRQLRVVTRDRLTLLQSLLFPLLSMVMFKVVLGDAVGQATGKNSAYGTVPLVVLVGAMFGSLAVGTRLMGERQTGLLTRLYVLPVHRAADLSSRVAVEMIRILVSTLVLTTAGMAIGWRFDQGLLPAIGIFGVALLYGAAYSTIVLTLSVSSSNVPLVPIMSLVTSLLMFFNSGFSPIEAYPEALQPLVRNQPMTCAIETMRALATGGPVAESLTKTICWAVAIILIFTYPALRGYRQAAASRT